MHELFLFFMTPFWFWTVLVLMSLAIIFFDDHDSNGGETVAFIIGVGALWVVSGMPWYGFSWFLSNWLTLLMYVGGYIAIGILYGPIIKWKFYLHNKLDSMDEPYFGYMNGDYYRGQKTIAQVVAESFPGYARRVKQNTGHETTLKEFMKEQFDIPPSPGKNKARITGWMLYWPWSAFWTLLNDPIKRLYRFIFQALTKMMTAMSEAVFGTRMKELQDQIAAEEAAKSPKVTS